MSKHQTTSTQTTNASDKKNTGVSPHLAWETPKHNPNETPKQKGQLGQNVRLKEKEERQKSH